MTWLFRILNYNFIIINYTI